MGCYNNNNMDNLPKCLLAIYGYIILTIISPVNPMSLGRPCSFTEFRGYVLHGNDNLIIRGISLSDCKNYCSEQSDPLCLSLEYDKEENCYLSANSNRTKPMDFTQSSSANYYENTCTLNMRPSAGDDNMVCPPYYFACDFSNQVCIPEKWRCDRYPDCRDESDELECHLLDSNNGNAGHSEEGNDNFVCMSTGAEISGDLYCDGKQDCPDNSDEDSCFEDDAADDSSSLVVQCDDDEFRCTELGECKPLSWICDGQNDCEDGYDEMDCEEEDDFDDDDFDDDTDDFEGEAMPQRGRHCDFHCLRSGRGKCLPQRLVCDGIEQCNNGRDEQDCSVCKERIMFTCKDLTEPRCVPKFFVCDGVSDCPDGSDEENCEDVHSCTPAQFKCATGHECEFLGWVCDGEPDCNDGSDEVSCSSRNCSDKFQFTCQSNGRCITNLWVCDGEEDCPDGSDEENCDSEEEIEQCQEDQFQCKDSSGCVPQKHLCDDDKDCIDGSDEEHCNGDCDWSSEIACTNGRKCIPKMWWCDGSPECEDGSDELDCD